MNNQLKEVADLVFDNENQKALEKLEDIDKTISMDIGTLEEDISFIKFTDKELEILSCIVENEIESDVDNLTIVKGEEKEFWKNRVLDLKNIKAQIDIQINRDIPFCSLCGETDFFNSNCKECKKTLKGN